MKNNKSLVALLKEMDQTECEDHIFIDQSTENKENTLLGHRPAQRCTITRVGTTRHLSGKNGLKWVSCTSQTQTWAGTAQVKHSQPRNLLGLLWTPCPSTTSYMFMNCIIYDAFTTNTCDQGIKFGAQPKTADMIMYHYCSILGVEWLLKRIWFHHMVVSGIRGTWIPSHQVFFRCMQDLSEWSHKVITICWSMGSHTFNKS